MRWRFVVVSGLKHQGFYPPVPSCCLWNIVHHFISFGIIAAIPVNLTTAKMVHCTCHLTSKNQNILITGTLWHYTSTWNFLSTKAVLIQIRASIYCVSEDSSPELECLCISWLFACSRNCYAKCTQHRWVSERWRQVCSEVFALSRSLLCPLLFVTGWYLRRQDRICNTQVNI